MSQISTNPISTTTHPYYDARLQDWCKFRHVFEGGSAFISRYLERFSLRESTEDFNRRLAITYNPAYAKAALTEIKNAIYQRMIDISRLGGPDSYKFAVREGVDLKGHSMNWFISNQVLPELMAMERVGIYVDKPILPKNTNKLTEKQFQPYIYTYKAEDIRSWSDGIKLTALLLREWVYTIDANGLPVGETEQFKLFRLTPVGISVETYDKDSKQIGQTLLNLPEIPFILAEIDQSLLTDIADHQIAVLNLASSDMNYSLKSNFPFYTEQYLPSGLELLQSAQTENRTDEGVTKKSADKTMDVGSTQGRKYQKGLERPGFINPSPEPLRVSMEKQQAIKEEIRELIGLNLASLQTRRASAESKQEDTRTKEEGLSALGLTLESVENQIAHFWSLYDKSEPATILYPANYSLISKAERLAEAKDLKDIAKDTPSKTFQKHIAKQIVEIVAESSVSQSELEAMKQEIDDARIIITDPDVIRQDVEAGLVDLATASLARGYPEGTVETAKEEHMQRLADIAMAQGGQMDQARGGQAGGVQSMMEKQGKPQRGQTKNRTA